MIYQKNLQFSTKGFADLINITENIKEGILDSGIKNGIALVFVTGSTAGITTIEYEPNLVKDFQDFIKELIPKEKKYHHNKAWGDGNGFSHLRASLIGPSLSLPFKGKKLSLGTWQQVVLCDFDNRSRKRDIIIKLIGD